MNINTGNWDPSIEDGPNVPPLLPSASIRIKKYDLIVFQYIWY